MYLVVGVMQNVLEIMEKTFADRVIFSRFSCKIHRFFNKISPSKAKYWTSITLQMYFGDFFIKEI